VDRNRYVALAVVFLILVAVVRILLTYKVTAQAFDEPCHVAAAIELLDKGTYTLDPVHPPLTRIAIGIPLYLAGARFPGWPATDPRVRNYNEVGNNILYSDGRYLRNLQLARSAVLPFFGLAVTLVFLWTRRGFGDFAAVMAAGLFTTLPIVLAFSGLAYTDLPTGCMQFAAILAFTMWLQKPTRRSSLVLGLAAGLAFLAKLTTLLFLPAAAAAILLTKRLKDQPQYQARHNAEATQADRRARWASKLCMAVAVAVIVIWAGYGFSVGHVRQAMQVSPESLPSFQHFPGPARRLALMMVQKDVLLPAPALARGIATAWVLNSNPSTAYLLGKVKDGGWWYFFLVGVGVKTPLPFLLLCLVGLWAVWATPMRWTAGAPAAAALSIFFVTMFVKYNAGVRHVMVVFPLLAVVAGCGCGFLWRLPGRWQVWGRSTLAALLLWQCVSSLKAAPDYIAYFNELAGRDPSRILVAGCDLDCGQDLFRLSQALRQRNISHLNLAVWTSADVSQMNLPSFETLPPSQPVTGWVAISLRSLRLGDVFHTSYPPDAFAWLNQREPVDKIGKTILLYYFPPDANAWTATAPSSGSKRIP
jgi:4-amino-4-deoxy-L-arabinose transferase-like glycosyltransferase